MFMSWGFHLLEAKLPDSPSPIKTVVWGNFKIFRLGEKKDKFMSCFRSRIALSLLRLQLAEEKEEW